MVEAAELDALNNAVAKRHKVYVFYEPAGDDSLVVHGGLLSLATSYYWGGAAENGLARGNKIMSMCPMTDSPNWHLYYVGSQKTFEVRAPVFTDVRGMRFLEYHSVAQDSVGGFFL